MVNIAFILGRRLNAPPTRLRAGISFGSAPVDVADFAFLTGQGDGAFGSNRRIVQRQIAFGDRLAARLSPLFGGGIVPLRLGPSHAPCLPLLPGEDGAGCGLCITAIGGRCRWY